MNAFALAPSAISRDPLTTSVENGSVPFFSPIRPLLKGWLISFLAWGSVALALGGHFVWQTGLPWSSAFWMSVHEWLPWAVVTPLLFRLVSRLPLDRQTWRLSFPVHFLACFAVLALCEWWTWTSMRWGNPALDSPMRRPPGESSDRGPSDSAPPERSVFVGRGGPPSGGPDGPGQGGPGGPGGPPREFRGFRMRGFRSGQVDVFRILAMRLPIYFGIISAAHAFLYAHRSQERERRSLGLEASLAKARLEAMKMQLQPHFLFNSLNAIAELVHAQPNAAEEMLVALSNLLRLTLSTSGEQELPLMRELEFVEHYMAIEHVRYGDRLRFERDVAPETFAALVPTFLLQPLVENAVRHGLEPSTTNGLLRITAQRDDDLLRLSVSDNGVGLPGGKIAREGIGLGNTRARLRELYGDAASIHLHNDHGLTVEITLPFRTS